MMQAIENVCQNGNRAELKFGDYPSFFRCHGWPSLYRRSRDTQGEIASASAPTTFAGVRAVGIAVPTAHPLPRRGLFVESACNIWKRTSARIIQGRIGLERDAVVDFLLPTSPPIGEPLANDALGRRIPTRCPKPTAWEEQIARERAMERERDDPIEQAIIHMIRWFSPDFEP